MVCVCKFLVCKTKMTGFTLGVLPYGKPHIHFSQFAKTLFKHVSHYLFYKKPECGGTVVFIK